MHNSIKMLLEIQIHQTLGWFWKGCFYKGNSKLGLNNVMHMIRRLYLLANAIVCNTQLLTMYAPRFKPPHYLIKSLRAK